MNTKERKEKERERKQRMILDAAKNLFIREGFDNVSMRRIALAAGYSPAAIYRYFSNKREILSHLREEGFRAFHVRQKQYDQSLEPVKLLRQAGRGYLRFAMEHPDDFHLMFCTTCEEVDLEGELAAESLRVFEHFRSMVVRIVKSGYFGDVDEEAAVFGLWAGVQGLANLVTSGRMQVLSDRDVDELLESTLNFLRR